MPGQAKYDAAVLALSGIQNYWPLTQASGTTYTDASGAANHATAAAAPSRVTGPDGVASAVDFAGTTNSVGLPGSSISLPESLTWCWWQKLNATPTGDAMALEWATAAFAKYHQFDLGNPGSVGGGGAGTRSSLGAYYGTVAGANSSWVAKSSFSTSAWNFVVVTFDNTLGSGNAMKVYVDGNLVSSVTGLTNYAQTVGAPGSGTLGIGGRGQGGRALPLNGAMSGLALYNRVLTQMEIWNLRAAMVTPPPAMLVDSTGNSPNDYNAFPGHAVMANGNAIAAWHQGNDHTGTTSCKIVYAIGTADGAGGWTWGAQQTLKTSAGVNLADVSCFTLANGKTGVMWNEASTPGVSNINTVTTLNVALTSDYGSSFAATKQIAMPGFASNGSGIAGAYGIAPCSPFQIPGGRILIPVYGFDDKTSTSGYGIEYVKCCYTDDEFTTAGVLSTIFPKTALTSYDETCIVRAPGGNLHAYARTIENGAFTIRLRISADDGSTWGSEQRVLGTGVGTAGYGGRPDAVVAGDGRLYLRTRLMDTGGVSSWTGYRSSTDGITFNSGVDPYTGGAEGTGVVSGSNRGPDIYGQFAVNGSKLSYVWAEEILTQGRIYNAIINAGSGATGIRNLMLTRVG